MKPVTKIFAGFGTMLAVIWIVAYLQSIIVEWAQFPLWLTGLFFAIVGGVAGFEGLSEIEKQKRIQSGK